MILFTVMLSFGPSESSPKLLRIITEMESLIGTKYAWGGSSTSGVDCTHLFTLAAKRVGIPVHYWPTSKLRHLPHVTPTIGATALFFKPGTHAAYFQVINPRNMIGSIIHATRSKGVVISGISPGSYWGKVYLFSVAYPLK